MTEGPQTEEGSAQSSGKAQINHVVPVPDGELAITALVRWGDSPSSSRQAC